MKFHWFNPFSWYSPKESQDVQNPIKQSPRRPVTRDWTEQWTINSELTRGLYHNSFPGLKLAGALAHKPIAIPILLMGLPIPKCDDPQTQLEAIKVIEDHADECHMNHLNSHLDGTSWVWPFYSAKLQKDCWEFIPDDTISDILRDVQTGELQAIITDEQILISTAYNVQGYVRRRRTFTREAVKIEWLENTMAIQGLEAGIFKNITGDLPIHFPNEADGDRIRGYSEYECMLSDLKNYHDTDLALSELITKFSPKMIQEVQDVDEWKANNGITNIDEIDIASRDFIINLFGKEKTTFEWPAGAQAAGLAKLSQIFWKIVQASPIPEILFGTKVEGSQGSNDNQIDSAIQFVESKQRMKNNPYKRLVESTMRLRNIISFKQTQPVVKSIQWNALDLISESAKATILTNFASGIAALINSAGITKPMVWKMFKKAYPESTDDDYQTFCDGLGEMAKHKAFAAAPYEIIADMTGEDDTLDIKPSTPIQSVAYEQPAK